MAGKAAKASSSDAEKLLAEGKSILKEIERAELFKQDAPRKFPTFHERELSFGQVLGVGGFCVVSEIQKIEPAASAVDEAAAVDTKKEEEDPSRQSRSWPSLTNDNPLEADNHYHVSDAKAIMTDRCLRDGLARYAVKRLHHNKDMSPLDVARGRIDLAIETKYLRSFNHPNLVKMRGYRDEGDGDWMDPSHFVILDRLYGTLNDRMDEWKCNAKQAGAFRLFRKNKGALRHIMQEKLICAYDLAVAMKYMHSMKVVYRDLKPENIGFDIRGDVKVFDFGLCKSLLPSLQNKDGMFNLTARTGSFPYMAPEVALCKPYNELCDVFSFSILLWEILSYKVAYENLKTRRAFYREIVIDKVRPPMGTGTSQWPQLTKHVMAEAWSANPRDRPNFTRLASIIRSDLNDLSDEDCVRNRTTHMTNRSRRSMHGVGGGGRRSSVRRPRASFASRKSSRGCADTERSSHRRSGKGEDGGDDWT